MDERYKVGDVVYCYDTPEKKSGYVLRITNAEEYEDGTRGYACEIVKTIEQSEIL